MPKWTPTPGAIAIYLGRTKASRRKVRVIAEAIAGRVIVEAVGRKGRNVHLTVKRENLVEPEPELLEDGEWRRSLPQSPVTFPKQADIPPIDPKTAEQLDLF